MNGAAVIFLGLLAFGCLHIRTPGFLPWQWLIVITGIITLFAAVAFWMFFPDSPTHAWFLTPEERVEVVVRIRDNQAGVENKTFKREQWGPSYHPGFCSTVSLKSHVTSGPSKPSRTLKPGFLRYLPLARKSSALSPVPYQSLSFSFSFLNRTIWNSVRPSHSAGCAHLLTRPCSSLTSARSS